MTSFEKISVKLHLFIFTTAIGSLGLLVLLFFMILASYLFFGPSSDFIKALDSFAVNFKHYLH